MIYLHFCWKIIDFVIQTLKNAVQNNHARNCIFYIYSSLQTRYSRNSPQGFVDDAVDVVVNPSGNTKEYHTYSAYNKRHFSIAIAGEMLNGVVALRNVHRLDNE